MNGVVRPVQRRERDGSGRVQIQVQLAPKISIPGLVLASAVKIGAVAARIERRIYWAVHCPSISIILLCYGDRAGCSGSGGPGPRPTAAQGLQRWKLERVVCKRHSLLPEVTPADVALARIDMCTFLDEAPSPAPTVTTFRKVEIAVRAHATVASSMSRSAPLIRVTLIKRRHSPKGRTTVSVGTAVRA